MNVTSEEDLQTPTDFDHSKQNEDLEQRLDTDLFGCYESLSHGVSIYFNRL